MLLFRRFGEGMTGEIGEGKAWLGGCGKERLKMREGGSG
jgi:hypothetical protein